LSHQDSPLGQPRANDERRIQWATLATAHDQMMAEMWQQLLKEEGIPSMLAPQDAVSFMGVAATPVRLLVPAEMVARAEEVLAGLAGEGDQ